MKAPPRRLLDKRDLEIRGGILEGFFGAGEAHRFISLSECENSLSTDARDSKLLDESMVRLFGASWVS